MILTQETIETTALKLAFSENGINTALINDLKDNALVAAQALKAKDSDLLDLPLDDITDACYVVIICSFLGKMLFKEGSHE